MEFNIDLVKITTPLVVPIILGLYATKIQGRHKRIELVSEFAQSYSAFLVLAQEYYYYMCRQRDDEKRLNIKNKMVEVKQPDAMIAIVNASFKGKDIQKRCSELREVTDAYTSMLSCTSLSDDETDPLNDQDIHASVFMQKVSRANTLYTEILGLIAKKT